MHRCVGWMTSMGALGIAFSALAQAQSDVPLPPVQDPIVGLLTWAMGNYGVAGGIALVLGYLIGKKGGVPVRLSDEDRELLQGKKK